jgi:hypothetical protein
MPPKGVSELDEAGTKYATNLIFINNPLALEPSCLILVSKTTCRATNMFRTCPNRVWLQSAINVLFNAMDNTFYGR